MTVARAPVHGWVNPNSSTNPLVLSALQLRRAHRKRHHIDLAVIKPIDDLVDNPIDSLL